MAETGGTLTVTLSRTGGTDPATVNYATSDGTAVNPGDYAAASGVANFGVGATTTSFNITINDDVIYEGNQTINLALSSPSGNAVLGAQSTAVATITDNDPAPTLAINSVSQAEGNSGTTAFTFTVTLTGATEQRASRTVRNCERDGGCAGRLHRDQRNAELCTWSDDAADHRAGERRHDVRAERGVHRESELPVNASITTGTGTGTIQNDDAGTADVGITKTANGGAFFANNPISYTLTATNAGPNAANAVVVTDVLRRAPRSYRQLRRRAPAPARRRRMLAWCDRKRRQRHDHADVHSGSGGTAQQHGHDLRRSAAGSESGERLGDLRGDGAARQPQFRSSAISRRFC